MLLQNDVSLSKYVISLFVLAILFQTTFSVTSRGISEQGREENNNKKAPHIYSSFLTTKNNILVSENSQI